MNCLKTLTTNHGCLASSEGKIQKLSYTIKEAAFALGLSRTTIYKLIGEGQIATTKVGARTLVPAQELLALLSQTDRA